MMFSSSRERRLWIMAAVTVIAIYATLGLAGTWAEALRERELLGGLFMLAFLLVIVTIAAIGWTRDTGHAEAWMFVGIVTVYGMIGVRMGVTPEERSHLFEYGLVAILVHQALLEGVAQGRRIRFPSVMAVVVTALIGWLDEGIQAVLPDRVYDIRDVGTNALAALMAVVASLAIRKARRRDRRTPPPDVPEPTDS
jgi:hypothetical protein